VQLGGDVGADDVLDADFGGFDFSGFEEAGHGAPLLLGYCFVFLLDHAEACDGELELYFELCLRGRGGEHVSVEGVGEEEMGWIWM